MGVDFDGRDVDIEPRFYADQLTFGELHQLAEDLDIDGTAGISYEMIRGFTDAQWCEFFACNLGELSWVLSEMTCRGAGDEFDEPVLYIGDDDDDFNFGGVEPTLEELLALENTPNLTENELDEIWEARQRRYERERKERDARERAWDDYEEYYDQRPFAASSSYGTGPYAYRAPIERNYTPRVIPHHLEVVV